jgi:wyosine [tRNA(Phe)-imidazoG37] synthetase (radical SAM superfamily)
MPTFLFDQIIFGPLWSRRLGESLGINLLPVGQKVCNFNCIYCECGLTPESDLHNFPSAETVIAQLDKKLSEMNKNGEYLDSITFAGNGEPTLHPEFPDIIEKTVDSRNRLFPGAKIAVLSNATLIGNKNIFNALMKVDLNILKLDSAVEETIKLINCPRGNYHLSEIINILKQFRGRLIIQTLFLRGNCKNKRIDNTTEAEISALVAAMEQIRPESIMLYSLARETAVNELEKVGEQELNYIAGRLVKAGLKTQVTP